MAFPNTVWGSEEESFKTTSTKRVPLGTKMVGEDGRIYRYVENGGVAMVVSEMQQSPVPSANFLVENVDTMAAGASVLTTVDSTTGDGAANLFEDGYVLSQTAGDLNPLYRIKSNTLINATPVAGQNTITLYNPLEAAIAAASTISYFPNPWRDVIQTVATTPTALVLGAAVKAIALDAFGWICSGGPAAVLNGGTTTVISDPCGPGDVAGSTIPIAATELTVPVYGHVLVAGTSGQDCVVFLQID
jgi:hypothetical protein